MADVPVLDEGVAHVLAELDSDLDVLHHDFLVGRLPGSGPAGAQNGGQNFDSGLILPYATEVFRLPQSVLWVHIIGAHGAKPVNSRGGVWVSAGSVCR